MAYDYFPTWELIGARLLSCITCNYMHYIIVIATIFLGWSTMHLRYSLICKGWFHGRDKFNAPQYECPIYLKDSYVSNLHDDAPLYNPTKHFSKEEDKHAQFCTAIDRWYSKKLSRLWHGGDPIHIHHMQFIHRPRIYM